MKKIISITGCAVIFASALISCSTKKDSTATDTQTDQASGTNNMLTAEEIAAGWQLLFDGESLDGWKRFNHDTIGPLWSVDDGKILCDGAGLGEGSGNMGGSLITTRAFGNFELVADFKLSPGGNSGILYHIVEDPKYKYDYETGPEYQVLDDTGWKGGELKDAQLAGSFYDVFPASKSKNLNPAGEWNTARIIYNNGHVEHWLNGDKVVEFDEDSEAFRSRVEKSKWTAYPDWNKSKTGAIGLQDHGAPVYFRNIKIREL